MDEQTLQVLSKALTHLVFRNRGVENFHVLARYYGQSWDLAEWIDLVM